MGTSDRVQAHALFSQTMGYVAATAGLFALGAWLGRSLTGGIGIVAFIAAFACLIGMRFAARRSVQLTVGLLAAFGLLIGLAVAPTVAYYGSMDPRAVAGRRGDRAVHRRLRRGGLRHPARPHRDRAAELLGAGGADRGGRRADLRPHPG
jgi:hypothetical protein